MVNKLDSQTMVSEFNSHWLPNTFGVVLHLSLVNNNYYFNWVGISCSVMVNKLDSQTMVSEVNSHWLPYTFSHVLHLTLVNNYYFKRVDTSWSAMVNKLDSQTIVSGWKVFLLYNRERQNTPDVWKYHLLLFFSLHYITWNVCKGRERERDKDSRVCIYTWADCQDLLWTTYSSLCPGWNLSWFM